MSTKAKSELSIQDIVLDFAHEVRRTRNRTFHMSDLNEHVAGFICVAPDSPGRILRMLRREGKLDYRLENRASSLYSIT